MNKKKVFQSKTVPEIIQINKTVDAPTMSESTVNRYLSSLSAFFKWCVGNGYMDTNYAEGKKVKTKRVSPDKQRDAFSTDDLKALFGAPGYTKDIFTEPYQFWLPILGLYTGARLNELCQLRLDDIQTIDGVYTFTFQEDAQDETISVKSDSGHRTIPIHPFVGDELNLKGYVEYLRSKGETRLFPELPYQNDNYGHKATKWFGRFRKACGIDSPKKVYHSFRHTLTDNLKQQLIKDSLIDELTGHVLQGETMGRYGKKYQVDVLYDAAILKLSYEVDLEPLKRSRWAKCGGQTKRL